LTLLRGPRGVPYRRESSVASPTALNCLGCHTRSVRVVRSPVLTVVSAVALAIVAVLLLLPTSGVDTQPPVCWATGGYEVSCSQAQAWGTAVVILIAGAVVTWRVRQGTRNAARNAARTKMRRTAA
jgi:cbb3-type cytochrome oxidase subunit 3